MCVCTTSITASLNLTSCKIFISATFGTIVDLYVDPGRGNSPPTNRVTVRLLYIYTLLGVQS